MKQQERKPPQENNDIENHIERQAHICKAIGIWNIIGRRWALLILKSLRKREVMRFSELKKALVEISSNVLTSRLEQLVREGLITKKIYEGSAPLKVEYRLLNPLALELNDILNNLDRWIDKWTPYKNKNVSLT